MTLVQSIKLSSKLVDGKFPELPGALQVAQIPYEISDSQEPLTAIIVFVSEYKTHWQSLRGEPGVMSKKIMYCQKVDSYLDVPDCDIVIAIPNKEADDTLRVGRILYSDSRFIEIKSPKDFIPTILTVIETFNKASSKKLPNLVNVYKPNRITMDTENETILASMLAQVQGLSEDSARAIARQTPSLKSFLAKLPDMDNMLIRTSKGERKVGGAIATKLRKLFGSESKGFDII